MADGLKGGEQEFEDIAVTLSKSPGRGLGLSVVGRRDGCGVFISDMVSHQIPYRYNLYDLEQISHKIPINPFMNANYLTGLISGRGWFCRIRWTYFS